MENRAGNRAENRAVCSSCQAFLGNLDTFRLLSNFWVILRSSSCACSLFTKSFQESWARTVTKPHTHLTRFIWLGMLISTDYANRLSHHELHVLGPVPANVRLNHLVKSKINLQFDRSITFEPDDGKSRRKSRRKSRSVLFVSGISWKFGHFSAPFQLLGNTTFKQLCLLSLYQKFPRILSPNCNKTSYASNSVYLARNADIQQTTLIGYPITNCTYLGPCPRTWGLIIWLKARSTCSLIVVLPLNQTMENRAGNRAENRAVCSSCQAFLGNLDTFRLLSNFWVILRSSSCACSLFTKSFQNPEPEL